MLRNKSSTRTSTKRCRSRHKQLHRLHQRQQSSSFQLPSSPSQKLSNDSQELPIHQQLQQKLQHQLPSQSLHRLVVNTSQFIENDQYDQDDGIVMELGDKIDRQNSTLSASSIIPPQSTNSYPNSPVTHSSTLSHSPTTHSSIVSHSSTVSHSTQRSNHSYLAINDGSIVSTNPSNQSPTHHLTTPSPPNHYPHHSPTLSNPLVQTNQHTLDQNFSSQSRNPTPSSDPLSISTMHSSHHHKNSTNSPSSQSHLHPTQLHPSLKTQSQRYPLLTYSKRTYRTNIRDFTMHKNAPVELDIPSKRDLALKHRVQNRTGEFTPPGSIALRRTPRKPGPQVRLRPAHQRQRDAKLDEMGDLQQDHSSGIDDIDPNTGLRRFLDLPILPIIHNPPNLIPSDAVSLFRREHIWRRHLDQLYDFQTTQPSKLNYTHPLPLCSPLEDHYKDLLTMIPRCNSIHPVPQLIGSLIEWINHFGGLLHPSIIPRPNDFSEINYGNWGIYATEDIPAYTCIMALPTSLMLQPEIPLFSPRDGYPTDVIGPDLFPILHKAGSFGLHIRLFLELANYFDSPYRPYLDTLPKSFPTSLAYKDIAQNTPIGDNLSLEVRQHLEELELLSYRGFEMVQQFIKARIPKEWYREVDYTWDVYQYIETLIFTRTFDIDRRLLHTAYNTFDYEFSDGENVDMNGVDGVGSNTNTGYKPKHRKKSNDAFQQHVLSPTQAVLIPGADLFNHSNAANVDWVFGKYAMKEIVVQPEQPFLARGDLWTENAIYFYTKRPVLKGEELTRMYYAKQTDYMNHLPKIRPLDEITSKEYARLIPKPLPVLPIKIPSYRNKEKNFVKKWSMGKFILDERKNDKYGYKRIKSSHNNSDDDDHDDGENDENDDPDNNNDDNLDDNPNNEPYKYNSSALIPKKISPPTTILPSYDHLRSEFAEVIEHFPEVNPLSNLSMNKVLRLSLIRYPYLNLEDFTPSQENYPHLSLFWVHGVTSKGNHLPYWTRDAIDPESGEPVMFDEKGHFFLKTPFFQDFNNISDILSYSGRYYKESLQNTNQWDILEHPMYIEQVENVVKYHIQHERQNSYPTTHLHFKRPPQLDPRIPLLFNSKIEDLPVEVAELLSDLLESVNTRAKRHDQSSQSIAQQFRQKFGSLSKHKDEFLQQNKASVKENQFPFDNFNNDLGGGYNVDDVQFDLAGNIIKNKNDQNQRPKFNPNTPPNHKSPRPKWSFSDLMSSLDNNNDENNKDRNDPDVLKHTRISQLYPFRFGLNYISPELEAIAYLLAAAATSLHILNTGMYHNLLSTIRTVFDPDRIIKEKHAKIREVAGVHRGHIEAEKMGYEPGPVPHMKHINMKELEQPDGTISDQNRAHQHRQYFHSHNGGGIGAAFGHNLNNDGGLGTGENVQGYNRITQGDQFAQLHRPAFAVLLGIMNVALIVQSPNLDVKRGGVIVGETGVSDHSAMVANKSYIDGGRGTTNNNNNNNTSTGFSYVNDTSSLSKKDKNDSGVHNNLLFQKHHNKNDNNNNKDDGDITTPLTIELSQPSKVRFGYGIKSDFIMNQRNDELLRHFVSMNETLQRHIKGDLVLLPPNDNVSGKPYRDFIDEVRGGNKGRIKGGNSGGGGDGQDNNNNNNDNDKMLVPSPASSRFLNRRNIKPMAIVNKDGSNKHGQNNDEINKLLQPTKQDLDAISFNQHAMRYYQPDGRSSHIHDGHDENPFILTPEQSELMDEITTLTIQRFENVPNLAIQHVFNSIATTMNVKNRFWALDSIINQNNDSNNNIKNRNDKSVIQNRPLSDNNSHENNNNRTNTAPRVICIEPNNLSNQIKHYNPKTPVSWVPTV